MKKKCCIKHKRKCKSIAIDGYSYNLKSQLQNGNSFYLCKKRHTERCHGKVVLSPNGLIVEKRNHSCSSIHKVDKPLEDDGLENVQEYEKISGRRFKINGYRYTLSHVHKTGNKYFKCVCAYLIGDKCPGFIIITPNNQIVKKVDHTCSGKYTVDKPSENNGLEEVQEYEGNGNNFKINGHTYHFTTEPKTGNKYFRCIYTNTKKCPGSFVITPNCGIAKKVEHTCIGIDAEEKLLEDSELEEVHEYEEIRNKFKINGHLYYFPSELSDNKYFKCIYANLTRKKCQGSILLTPNNRIAKKVDHSCHQVCKITPQKTSKTAEEKACPSLSVGLLK